MTKTTALKRKRRKPNEELYNFLYKNGLDYTINELLPMVNGLFDEDYTNNELRKYMVRNKLQYKYERPDLSHSHSQYKIGSEYTRNDGMVMVKVGINEWKYKQRYVYEKKHNVELTRKDFIIFLNGNRNDFRASNLAKIDSSISSYMANRHLFFDNKLMTKIGILIAKFMVKRKRTNGSKNNKI